MTSQIHESLLHCPQIGPKRLSRLHAADIRSWQDVIDREAELPSGIREPIVAEARRCLDALHRKDIGYFVENLSTKDRWRILSQFLGEVSFFDIETSGLEYDDPITVIACWHRGAIHTFIEHENLDDFLDLLDEVTLLSSFNGSTFDVPRVLDAFHIPQLPCPHLDLRWLCYHQNLRGGLKDITRRLGLNRPEDLQEADGELAIRLWARWEHFNEREALDELLRYCASDVLLLVLLAQRLCGNPDTTTTGDIWQHLPAARGPSAAKPKLEVPPAMDAFGVGSPKQLRARRKRVG